MTALQPTPTEDPTLPHRMADFDTLSEGLDYAAKGNRGFNFYSARGELERVLPYSELREKSLEHAKRLITAGLERGTRVALVADISADFLMSFFACQYAGLIAVPLPIPISFGGRDGYINQLARQLESCGASAMLYPESVAELSAEAGARVELALFASYGELSSLPIGDVAPIASGKDDISYLQYSSGSTRFPHGITIMQSAAVANCVGNATFGVELEAHDRMVSWLPFYHDMGLVGCMLTLMMTQISCDYLPTDYFARRPMLWLEIMSRNKATLSYGPGFGYELVSRRVNTARLAELDLSSWRIAGLGAEMIRAGTMRLFAETFAPAGFQATAFLPSYGLAEATLALTFMPVGIGVVADKVDEAALSERNLAVIATKDTEKVREVVNCGVTLPGHEIIIRNDNDGVCADREIGKIFARGPSVMSGYYNDPETTLNVLDSEGWLDTGDMGYFVKDSLYIVGRAKDLIILNGQNLWPQDLEWTVEQIEGLKNDDCVAISVPGPAGEEIAMILVQCRTKSVEKMAELVVEIKKSVQKQMSIPCHVTLVKPRSLPRTSSGKLSRAKTRDHFLGGLLEALDCSDPYELPQASKTTAAAAR